MTLAGSVALVTGGAGGIGRGIVMQLARAGADVAIADLQLDRAEESAALVRGLGRRAVALRADVTSWGDCQAMVERTVAELGSLEIAVNNVGVVSFHPVHELTEQQWDTVMDVNAKGVFLSCKAELAVMRPRRFGRIVNIASVAGRVGSPGLSHYCASKFAVIGFTNSLAKEVAREGITANVICPGTVATGMWAGPGGLAETFRIGGETAEQAWERIVTTAIPQGEPQTPEDIGDLVVYLARAPHVTGQALAVDGGGTGP